MMEAIAVTTINRSVRRLARRAAGADGEVVGERIGS